MRELTVWIPGIPLGMNAFRKLNTRGRMARIETERSKAKMCALAAVRPKYRAPDDVWIGPTSIDFEMRTSRVFKDALVLGGSLKHYQDGICLAVLPLGDGPVILGGEKTPYLWNPPTQVKVKTRAEEGVLVRIAEMKASLTMGTYEAWKGND
jgi:hypothetical protein